MIIVLICAVAMALVFIGLAFRRAPVRPRRYMLSGRARDTDPERVYRLRLARNTKARRAERLMQLWRDNPRSEGREPEKAQVIPIRAR